MNANFNEEDINELLEIANQNKFIDPEVFRRKLDEWKNETLNICITGETKAGKSTLINTLRGLFISDIGAAKVGVTPVTSFPTPFEHPRNSNLILWDTPGYNVPNLRVETYIEDITTIHHDQSELFE